MKMDRTGCSMCRYLQIPDPVKFKETENKNFMKYWCGLHDKAPVKIRRCSWADKNKAKRDRNKKWYDKKKRKENEKI